MAQPILFQKVYTIAAEDPMSYGEASSHIKKTLKQLGLPAALIKRTAISMYEAEINTIIHGGGGTCQVSITPASIRIVFEDHGPGIPDIDLAMKEGYSTATPEVREMGFGAGLGLPNIKKNSDELSIESKAGEGTRVTILIATDEE